MGALAMTITCPVAVNIARLEGNPQASWGWIDDYVTR